MLIVSITNLKHNLSKYVRLIEEEVEEMIVVAKRGKPFLIITPFNNKTPIRVGAGELLFGKKEFVLKDPIYNSLFKFI